MIQLVITACSILHGAACKDFVNTYDAHKVSMFQCMMMTQPQLAKWQQAHPNWRIARYRCRIPIDGVAEL